MLGRIDLALRFLYVIAIPSILGAISALAPVGGIVIGTGLATAVALIGTRRWRASVEGIPVLGRPLASFGQLGEYYAESPPKPLLYYLLYPALFPYWLFAKNARREFVLYRQLNLIVMAIIVVSGLVEYFAVWRPLSFDVFFGTAFGMFFIQLVILAIMVMPIVTTVVILHRDHHPKWLGALLVLGGLSGALGISVRHNVKGQPFDVEQRVKFRDEQFHEQSVAALTAGVDAAAMSLASDPDVTHATRAARHALGSLYRADEERAFEVWNGNGVVMLYAHVGSKKSVWRARDVQHTFDDPAQLPDAARAIVSR